MQGQAPWPDIWTVMSRPGTGSSTLQRGTEREREREREKKRVNVRKIKWMVLQHLGNLF